MCKRFWIGSMICLLAMISTPTFVAISDDSERDEIVVAGACITKGSTKIKAKGTVHAERTSVIGAWGIQVRAGDEQAGTSRVSYRRGCRRSYRVEDYGPRASASSWISGNNKHGDAYFAPADDYEPREDN